jgi:ssDNA-binding replication factor A large subunit
VNLLQRRSRSSIEVIIELRKGDFVKAEKAGKIFSGWCSGDTAKQVKVNNWHPTSLLQVELIVIQ